MPDDSDTENEDGEYEQYGYMGEPATAEFNDIYQFLSVDLERDTAADVGPDGVSYLLEEASTRLVQYFTTGSSIIEYFSSELLALLKYSFANRMGSV